MKNYGVLTLAIAFCACSSSPSDGGFGDDGGPDGGAQTAEAGPGGGGAGTCAPCAKSSDCGGGDVCATLGAARYCVATCGGGGACGSGTACTGATSAEGQPAQVCAPRGGVCTGADSGTGGSSGGGGGDSGKGGGGDSSTPLSDSGSGAVTGTVGANGGSLSRLLFAVAGDTRPPNPDDVSGYPTAIITKIYQDIEALDPHPPFVVSTGDYQFASTGSSSTAKQQLALYMTARKLFSGAWYPAFGNHECTGADNSNCVGSSANTQNYLQFMQQMLAPISKTLPYYVIPINALDGSWTAKFVFVAPNAWDGTQQSWLQTTLAAKTTYTFVIRHEPSNDTGNPAGVAASDAIINASAYTMMIVGHTHSYGHYSDTPKTAIVGNGGAPLSSKSYGYAIFSQRADGAIVADEVDYQTGATDPYFHFVMTPGGTLTQ